jgi:CTD small phosphatase-like protein 2
MPDYKVIAELCPHDAIGKINRNSPEMTLVLDLDETLIHSTCTPTSQYDHTIVMNNGVAEVAVYVNLRPWVRHFLEQLADDFEIVIFTASEVITSIVNFLERIC